MIINDPEAHLSIEGNKYNLKDFTVNHTRGWSQSSGHLSTGESIDKDIIPAFFEALPLGKEASIDISNIGRVQSPLFVGILSSSGGSISAEQARNHFSILPLLSKITDYGVLSENVFKLNAEDELEEEEGRTSTDAKNASLVRFGPPYNHGDDIAEWLVEWLTEVTNADSSDFPIQSAGPIGAKYDFSDTLEQAVLSLGQRDSRIDADFMHVLDSLLSSLGLYISYSEDISGKFSIHPSNNVSKTASAHVPLSVITGITSGYSGSLYSNFRVWVRKNLENPKRAGDNPPSAFTAQESEIDLKYWVYPEDEDDGAIMDRLVHRPPVFSWGITIPREGAIDVGKAYAQYAWSEMKWSNTNTSLTVLPTQYSFFLPHIGKTISYDHMGKDNQVSKLFGVLEGVNFSFNKGDGDTPGRISLQLDVSHVRDGQENNKHGFDDHPLYDTDPPPEEKPILEPDSFMGMGGSGEDTSLTDDFDF